MKMLSSIIISVALVLAVGLSRSRERVDLAIDVGLGLNPSRAGKLSSGSPSSCTLDFGELQVG